MMPFIDKGVHFRLLALRFPFHVHAAPVAHFTSSCNHRHKLQPIHRHDRILYNPVLLTATGTQCRYFGLSIVLYKEESKVEQTVKAIKDEKDKVEEKKPYFHRPELNIKPAKPEPPTEVVKLTLWDKVKHEAKHYYNGFKLLFVDVKICSRLLLRAMRGKTLTRRERRQLVRTTADLFRLVPFSVFVIVPFMEFLLPVVIKLFPNMLPSTFQEASKEKEKRRKALKVKLEMAKFLQDTIEETALQKSSKSKKDGKGKHKVAEFAAFMHRVRSTGSITNNEEIMKYSKVFEDEITLDNLNHMQLVALCKVLEIGGASIAPNNILRFQIEMKLRQLEADDKIIRKEGIDSLTSSELQEACRSRGMRALGMSADRLREQLSQWIKLHLDARIPTSLLVLSRTLYLPETVPTEDVLKATLSQLPDTADSEAKLKISETEGERVDNKSKLEVIKQEQALIDEEEKEKEEEDAKEAEKEAVPQGEVLVDKAPTIEPVLEEVLVDKTTPLVEDVKAEEEVAKEVTADDIQEVEKILEQVAGEKNLDIEVIEQADLEELKEDRAEYDESVEELKTLVVGEEAELQESKQTKRLKSKLNKMVVQIDDAIATLNKEKDLLSDRVEDLSVKIEEVDKSDEDLKRDFRKQESEERQHLIEVIDLVNKMKKLKSIPEDVDKYQEILENLDTNKDGKVDLERALKVNFGVMGVIIFFSQVLEIIGSENVKLKTNDVSEIMQLLKKEEQVEEEEKLEKQMDKSDKP